jgi:hypothetical protein
MIVSKKLRNLETSANRIRESTLSLYHASKYGLDASEYWKLSALALDLQSKLKSLRIRQLERKYAERDFQGVPFIELEKGNNSL